MAIPQDLDFLPSHVSKTLGFNVRPHKQLHAHVAEFKFLLVEG